jgi:prepilin-type N-terminal cleavage/methylation domain-containing protein
VIALGSDKLPFTILKKEVFDLKKQRGFSLIELLIVVAIILIIAAIAIPNLLRSRMAANEASAVGSIRSINTAAVTYSSTYPDIGYPTPLAQTKASATAGSGGADLIDSVLGGGTKSGYTFVMGAGSGGATTPQTTYTVSSKPLSASSGTRGFFSDQSGVIRGDASGTATSTSAPLQ